MFVFNINRRRVIYGYKIICTEYENENLIEYTLQFIVMFSLVFIEYEV